MTARKKADVVDITGRLGQESITLPPLRLPCRPASWTRAILRLEEAEETINSLRIRRGQVAVGLEEMATDLDLAKAAAMAAERDSLISPSKETEAALRKARARVATLEASLTDMHNNAVLLEKMENEARGQLRELREAVRSEGGRYWRGVYMARRQALIDAVTPLLVEMGALQLLSRSAYDPVGWVDTSEGALPHNWMAMQAEQRAAQLRDVVPTTNGDNDD